MISISGTSASCQRAATRAQDGNDFALPAKLRNSNGLVTPPPGPSLPARGLAFQAREIEELADVYFFRPLGILVARPAATLGLTPTQITFASMLVGVLGAALLYDPRLGLPAFVLLIAYSILDSADGQLARLTGQVTELGRVLDGVIGYVVYTALYLALTAGLLHRGASGTIVVWMLLAVISNIAQAQMYDYHRHHYVSIVVRGTIVRDDPAKISSPLIAWIYRGYLALQRGLNGLHGEVEKRIGARAHDGVVPAPDQARYRACFYRPVRGWNLLGDNTRFYAIGLLALIHRLDLFFSFIVVPMNLALVALWFWQRQADRRFLRS
ncbi:MAG: CDP-alcohol phosphatidyltransferase family protein [Chthoniobacterales bacterium]